MRLSRLLFFLPAVLLFIGFFHHINAYDQDLGRHLLTGEIILKTMHIPSVNLFSYTYPNFPFINHHWGSEIIFYLVKTLSGDGGLFILSLVLIFSAVGIIFYYSQKKARVIPLVITSLIYLGVLFERTDLRPELFSFLYLSCMVTLLYYFRERSTKLIFILPLIELLWTNSHIYFPVGVLVMLLFVIDELIIHRKHLLNPHTKLLVGIFLLTGAVTLINPHFLTGALYPLRVFQNYGYTIEENQTPFLLQSLGFSKPSFLYFELAVVLLFGSLLFNIKKTRPIDWFLSLVFTLVAVSAVRNFPLFVFTTFIPCAIAFSDVTKSISAFIIKKPPIWRILLLLVLAGITTWQAQNLLARGNFGYGVNISGESALDFVMQNKIKGPIFNNFDIGSYIEFRLYPAEKVFIDGRPEAYPASFIQDTYIKMQENPELFADVSHRYHINAIIFSHTDQTPWAGRFLSSIIKNPEWVTVYLDENMIILLKRTQENASLIQKYALNLSTPLPKLPEEEGGLRRLGHFYNTLGLNTPLEGVLQKLLVHQPNDCASLRILASIYAEAGNSAAYVYSQRAQAVCPL